jgi:hypothetical protein
MKNKEIAVSVRHQFAAKRRADGKFGRLFLVNAVTMASRVRVDILRAMVK